MNIFISEPKHKEVGCERSERARNLSQELVSDHPKSNDAEQLEFSISPLIDTRQNMKSDISHSSSNLYQRPNGNQGRKPTLPDNMQAHSYHKPSTKLRIFSEDDDQLPVALNTDHDSRVSQTLDSHSTKRAASPLNEYTNIPYQANASSAPFNTGVRQKPIKAVKPYCYPDVARVSPADDTEERIVKPKLFSSQPRLHSGAEKYDTEPHGSHESQTNEQHNRRRKPKRSVSDFKSDDTNTVTLQKTDIVMLKINGFTRKCGDCKVSLVEKECRVEFNGDDESISQAKIKMYETLQNVEEISKVLPRHLVEYIDRSQGYLRAQLTKRKIGAALKIDVSQSTVQCLAFTAKQAERGLDFVTKELSSKQIKIREGQSQCFENAEWDNLRKSFQKQVQVTVVKEDDVVDIVAYNEDSVNMAYRKSIQYLRESKPKHKTEVELKGATARCFRRHFVHELQQTIR